ncbi:MAG TPA: 3'-5' exonuclease [Bacteroidia bacterium]|nr:3'-5' exonuclease [Bacteroidia bacterium]
MLGNIPIEHILFLDIETVPLQASFDELNEVQRKLWLHKASFLKKDENQTDEEFYSRAGIYAEFGKIVCISCGFITTHKGERQFRTKSFFNDDEQIILAEFAKLLNIHFSRYESLLCAHNGKEFDFPFIARRMIINKIAIPFALDIASKKPWEVPHLDTMELWKFGDYKNYTPLNVLANVLGIESPKNDIDGSMIHQIYWQEKDLQRIAKYCTKDVITVAQILLWFKGLPYLNADEIILS